MLMAQPLALLRVLMPVMVTCRTSVKDVQEALLRLLQLPLDDQVMPAALSCDAACAWVRKVAACAGAEKATAAAVATANAPRRVEARRTRRSMGVSLEA